LQVAERPAILFAEFPVRGVDGLGMGKPDAGFVAAAEPEQAETESDLGIGEGGAALGVVQLGSKLGSALE
jgi:hypothetical protein